MMKDKNRLSWIELSRSAVNHNIASVAGRTNGKMVAVSVKANAYGHGLKEIVSIINKNERVDYLTVHSIEEAAGCREAGWKRPVMVLGPIALEDTAAVFEYDLEPVIFNRQFLDKLGRMSAKLGREVKTHLKLETGTHRQGITESDLPPFAETYRKYATLKKPYGASMHFANIEDTTNHEYAEYQLKNFRRMLQKMASLNIKPQIRHTASSAAAILFKKTHFEMVRPGVVIYGYWPSKETYLSYRLKGGENDLFKPVLSWKTRVTQIKNLAADSFIGYGCTYRTTAPTRLAVLPIGYYDGYDRALSNLSYVLINDRRAPVRGRICMNLTMVDITDIKGVRLEDPAIVIGRDKSEQIVADQLAAWTGTITYEVLSRLSPHTPRLIVT